MDAPLLQALGNPPAQGRVPRASEPAWGAARTLLRRSLREVGTPLPVRSPRVLWQMCRPGEPPRTFTWGEL
eukprot:411747-Prorocentrum_lima.AAC.1